MLTKIYLKFQWLVFAVFFVKLLYAQDCFSLAEFASIEFDPISQKPFWDLENSMLIPKLQSGVYTISPVFPKQVMDKMEIEAEESSYKITYCGGEWKAWVFPYEKDTYVICSLLMTFPELTIHAKRIHYFWRYSEKDKMSHLVLREDTAAYAYYFAVLEENGNIRIHTIPRDSLKDIISNSQYEYMMENYSHLLPVTPRLADEIWNKIDVLSQQGKQYTFTFFK